MPRSSDVRVEVVANREIAPSYFSMRLAVPPRLARFRPGEFLMLGWDEGCDPFLPRAMSIRSAKCGVRSAGWEVEILYKIYGRGTALLAAMRPGRFLRALGPLGNAFEVPRSATGVIMVAGGIGVPPIAALAESLAKRRTSRRTEMTVFLGGRSKADLLCAADFRRAGAKVHMATEDGSSGYKGLVTEAVEEFLRTSHLAPRTAHLSGRTSHLAPRTVLYACGPHPMLAALMPIAEKYDLPYQASLEANMACGFGACVGCVVPVKGGEGHRTYRLVCKDGPVFDAHHILWA
ncbi:MAG: dihydroorotate dehydrogenase electron transfer subunit [candidate division NC10 bacterium]|nr:dihydroorotate dehydrogenase electron transfer subunit [candidate division NC10 bacterium]